MLRGVIGGLQRWQYRGGRPRWSARITNRLGSIIFAAGIGPNQAATLEVRGHKSGRTISFPVVVADYEGERYLVAMLGQQTTGFVTCAPATAVRCCSTGSAKTSLWWRTSPISEPQSCAVPRPGGRSTSVLRDRAQCAAPRIRAHRRPVSRLSRRLMALRRGHCHSSPHSSTR
jgi:hypothetical protein